MRTKQPPQQKKVSKSKKIKPPNPRKGLFPRISAVFHCINFGVAMFIVTVKLIQFNDAPPNLVTMHPQPYNDAPSHKRLESAFLHKSVPPAKPVVWFSPYKGSLPALESKDSPKVSHLQHHFLSAHKSSSQFFLLTFLD